MASNLSKKTINQNFDKIMKPQQFQDTKEKRFLQNMIHNPSRCKLNFKLKIKSKSTLNKVFSRNQYFNIQSSQNLGNASPVPPSFPTVFSPRSRLETLENMSPMMRNSSLKKRSKTNLFRFTNYNINEDSTELIRNNSNLKYHNESPGIQSRNQDIDPRKSVLKFFNSDSEEWNNEDIDQFRKTVTYSDLQSK